MVMTRVAGFPSFHMPCRISSLLQKPLRGGIPGQGQGGYDKYDTRHRHPGPQPPQPTDVHVRMLPDRMEDVPSAQEQERLEQRVGCQVEHRRGEGAVAQGEHHEPDLANRGIGQDPFQVRRRQGHCGPHHRRDEPDGNDEFPCTRRSLEKGQHPRYQIDPCHDHRSGVYQGTHGSGAFHGVGEPDVERELRRLPHRAEEDQDGAQGHNAAAQLPCLDRLQNGRDMESAQLVVQQQDPHQQPNVSDARRDERLLRCLRRRPPLVPETYQQV